MKTYKKLTGISWPATLLADSAYDAQHVVHSDHVSKDSDAGALYVPPSGPTPAPPSAAAEVQSTPHIHAQGNESNSPADETTPEPSEAYQVRAHLGCMMSVFSVPLECTAYQAQEIQAYMVASRRSLLYNVCVGISMQPA